MITNIIHKVITYISFAAFLLMSISCSDSFLEVSDRSTTYRQTEIQDLESLERFTNGIYYRLARSTEDGLQVIYPELIADNVLPSSSPPEPMKLHYDWQQKSDTESGSLISALSNNTLWLNSYGAIRMCNFVIEEIGKFKTENERRANHIAAQAYALRAYIYFRLVNVFAQTYNFSEDASHDGIPYITQSDITAPYKRNTVKEVYEAITTDLTNAEKLVDASNTDPRFVTNYTVKALLARIMLFRGDFINALALSEQICNAFPLTEISNGYPTVLFQFTNKSEVIFQLPPGTSDYTYSFINSNYYYSLEKLFYATSDMSEALLADPIDVRSQWVSYDGTNWNITKFPVGLVPECPTPEIAYYHPIFRSSEFFLTAAEAAAKLGDEERARTYLNKVIMRANLGAEPVNVAGETLLERIYLERRKELCFEGIRMFDLQRLNKAVVRKDVLVGSPTTLNYPSANAIAPIPQLEIDIQGIKQNEGY